jgi:hypothetical protein
MKFEKSFYKLISEDMTSASAFTQAHTSGATAGGLETVDSYAPGDARMPHALGTIEMRRDKRKKKKSKSKSTKSKKNTPKVPNEKFPLLQSRNSGMTGPSNNPGFGVM